jgi:polyribonucleotide nucleotidyltransferase
MRKGLLVVGVGLIASLLAPTGAQAQRRGDWYRDVRPYLGGRGEEAARKARLVEDTINLRSDVRSADRRGDISPRQADRFYDRLDKVAKFLRDDRHLSNSEFNRRRDDLDHIARDLDHATRNRVSRRDDRYGRYDRDDRRSDRDDRRYGRYDQR